MSASLSLLIAGLMLGGSDAAPAKPAVRVSGPEVTRLDFGADEVVGHLQRPEGDAVAGRLGTRQPSLIRARENFVPEILKSADDL